MQKYYCNVTRSSFSYVKKNKDNGFIPDKISHNQQLLNQKSISITCKFYTFTILKTLANAIERTTLSGSEKGNKRILPYQNTFIDHKNCVREFQVLRKQKN